jgi:hypothetical protein
VTNTSDGHRGHCARAQDEDVDVAWARNFDNQKGRNLDIHQKSEADAYMGGRARPEPECELGSGENNTKKYADRHQQMPGGIYPRTRTYLSYYFREDVYAFSIYKVVTKGGHALFRANNIHLVPWTTKHTCAQNRIY